MKKMKRFTLTGLACLLLLTAGINVPETVQAEGNQVTFTVNGEVMNSPAGETPYLEGGAVMVPVRQTGKLLGYEATYIRENASLQIHSSTIKLEMKLGSGQFLLNGKETLTIEGAAVLKRNRIYIPLALLDEIGYITNSSANSAEAMAWTPQYYTAAVMNDLASGRYAAVSERWFSPEVRKNLSVVKLQQGWESMTSAYGKYVDQHSLTSSREQGQHLLAVTAAFEQGEMNTTITVDGSGKIQGLRFAPGAASAAAPDLALPEGVTEEEVTVGAGTAHPLKGILTLPAKSAKPLPSVILVHGSGSSDLNEAAYAYKPFRDIAYGLAGQGIAVLRYNKRVYSYPQQFTGAAAAGVTVKEETIEDAIAAAALLKQDPRLNAAQVYLAGHSLGGMLGPRIDAEGGGFAGLILLAGSPRSLWEIIYDQNMMLLGKLADTAPGKAEAAAVVNAELAKAQALSSLTDEQAKAAASVFGASAYYLKEMDQHSAANLGRKLAKPVLVLQGSDDFQIFADKDYPLWKDVLKGNSSAEFKLYPGLNHFFVNYDGEASGTAEEYKVPGLVDAQVIKDMGQWIMKHNK
ncbi:alpha/beta fold hydrolase [Paenibacillus sp. MMS20-IR301]|uniref:alpha/beta fold hydrolase n=1 Tax=Paenibacillus sp. MMS20-IR301 TaxID=2895946 RepID=UPI0028E23C9A|nr:alpha/beta fold hydrolase [Paenibacillus sp. MMS20-IR301]WNS45534.1 alpha/beta fold hydrolase [Paenibacillus sp. MMS20-IR301]